MEEMYSMTLKNTTNEGVSFSDGIAKVNGVLHRMLMDNHGSKMLEYKSRFIKPIDLEL